MIHFAEMAAHMCIFLSVVVSLQLLLVSVFPTIVYLGFDVLI